MTEVIAADGSKQETSLPAEAVADLQAKPEKPVVEPAKVEEPAKPTAEPIKTEEPKVEKPKEPEGKKPDESQTPPAKPKKASPIANLLNQRHELETALADKDQLILDLQAQVQKASQAPANTDKVKALAAKFGLEEDFVSEMVAAAREGFSPGVPKEVQDLIAEREASKQEQAETAAFNKRADSLAATLKDDQLKDPSVREKLMKLAYSTEKALDGEPYYQKELAELYFGFIKPEVEPGKASVDASRGASAGTKVLDFAEIKDDAEAIAKLSPQEYDKFHTWLRDTTGDVPLRKLPTV